MDSAEAGEAGDASLKHSSRIWVAGCSRRASSCAQMMMMLLPLSAGSHFSGKLSGFCWGRVIFFAVISWRDGGWVRDPIEVAFHGKSGHNIHMYIKTMGEN